ncbi:MAG: hypothetical protein K8Q99_03610 [Acholeplasmataceae bacterium]|nr:hypothetical protein [Acholeplasmataceae bacterium]
MQHILTKGFYYVGDPAYIIMKNKEGNDFIETLWKLFYKDMNKFHELVINDVKFYAFRTEGGDGFFDGIGTDTGVIIILDLNQVKGNPVFKSEFRENGCKIIHITEDTIAEVLDFNLEIKGYLKVETQ